MTEVQGFQNKQSAADCCTGNACQASVNTAPLPSDAPADTQASQYRIANMDCPVEEKLIRNKLEGMSGIVRLDFNLMQRMLHVHHQLDNLEAVSKALKAIGMDAQLLDSAARPARDHAQASLSASQKSLLVISGVAALMAEILAWTSHSDGAPLVIALACISIATGGLPTLKKGWIALKTFTLNINFLMSLAVLGAVAIGQWPEAAMVIFLFAVAELIESLSLNHARNAVHGLLKLAPDSVNLRSANGEWQQQAVETAAIGDLMRVKPGERFALDGVVASGESSVNQAPITGESMPVEKHAGDAVYAGSINQYGLLEITVSSNSGNSTLAKIVRVIEETQNNKAATQRFVDTFARYYTPAVVIMAVLVAVLPPLMFGAEFAPWLYKALVMLVIACPCALVISTPVTVVSGLTAAARLRVLVKGGEFLEVAHKLKAIALDKTGTLTAGLPSVLNVKPTADIQHAEILLLAASLDVNSDHPLANAIVKAGPESLHHKSVANFSALPGRGVKGEIDGKLYYLGNHRLMEELQVCSPTIEVLLDEIEDAAQTAVMLATENNVIGIIAIADSLRESAIEGVRQLNQLGITTVMLTGDNHRTAQQIASHVGIDVIKAELLPEDKLKEIKNLQSTYGLVGMLGDGINDAPALAQANIGFAMGAAGSDTAIETADVALMNDDLRKLAQFIKLGRASRSILMQNIGAAIGIKLVFFTLALFGMASLWMAVFADVGASLLVVFNGLRLLKKTYV